MPKRSEKRDDAKRIFLERNGKVKLKEFADELGVRYDLVRRWKVIDKWDEALEAMLSLRKKGGQLGNKNAAGHGAPPRNTNAATHGAHCKIYMDKLTDEQKKLLEQAPQTPDDALYHEYTILLLREHGLMEIIDNIQKAPENTLYTNSVMNMEGPGKGSEKGQDGRYTNPKLIMAMTSQSSPFDRMLKVQAELTKVQGRLAAIISTMRQAGMDTERLAIERERLALMRQRVTGVWDVDPDDDSDSGDTGAPLDGITIVCEGMDEDDHLDE